MLRTLVLALAIAGCLERHSVVCGDGRICAPGTVCIAVLDVCASPEQLAACEGLADNTPCDTETISDGTCRGGVCLPSQCGDGVVSASEDCDPLATATEPCAGVVFDRGFQSCSSTCQLQLTAATCGYIGWRTRQPVPQSTRVTALAPSGPGHGFYADTQNLHRYYNYTPGAPGSTPYLLTNLVTAIWAADEHLAVAVGESGLIVRWTDAWNAETSGTTAVLRGVWGRSANDVYAVGDNGTVHHFQNGQWFPLVPPTVANLRAVAGDANRVYVVGDAGTALVYESGAWGTLAVGTTRDLFGVSVVGDDVMMVGEAGTIVQREGSSWRPGRSDATATLRSVYGNAETGFFAAGDSGTMLFYDENGDVWRRLALGRGVIGAADQDFILVGGVGDEIGAVGTEDVITYEGAAWSVGALPASTNVAAIWGRASDDVYAVGTNGIVLHHDGLTWTQEASGTSLDLHGVDGDASRVHVVGDDMTVLVRDSGTWTTRNSGSIGSITGSLRAISVLDENRRLLAGDNGILLDDGAFEVSSTVGARSLWDADTGLAWAVGSRVMRWDGSAWTDDSAPVAGTLTSISGTAADAIFAVGSTSIRRTAQWFGGPFKDTDLAGVFASAELGVFAVGPNKLRHWRGGAVESLQSRTVAKLRAVFASGQMVFIGGDDGTLHALVFHR